MYASGLRWEVAFLAEAAVFYEKQRQELTNSIPSGILKLLVRKDWSEGYCHFGRRLSHILRKEVLLLAYYGNVTYLRIYSDNPHQR